jgi:hypothetical protein
LHPSLPPALQVIIGTHGKLKAWVTKRLLNLDNIRILVSEHWLKLVQGSNSTNQTS